MTPLDRIANAGLTLSIAGQDWTFRELTYRQRAELIAITRGLALRVYLKESPAFPDMEPRRRAMDLNAILLGTMAQDIDWENPEVRHAALKASLVASHPNVGDDDVQCILRTTMAQRDMDALWALVVTGKLAEPKEDAPPANPT